MEGERDSKAEGGGRRVGGGWGGVSILRERWNGERGMAWGEREREREREDGQWRQVHWVYSIRLGLIDIDAPTADSAACAAYENCNHETGRHGFDCCHGKIGEEGD